MFHGATDFQLMQQHVHEQPRPLRTLRPDVPEPLEPLVLDLLAKAPEQRPVDAYEVYEQLLPFLPLPGTPLPATEHAPTGIPDPTLLDRQPNAPHPRPESMPKTAAPVTATPPARPAPVLPTGVRETINAAVGLRQAAHCRAQLGQTTMALRQFQQVLTHVRAESGDASPTALDLRRNIGALLASEGRVPEAIGELDQLYEDLCMVYGADHEETREVAGMLARLRLAEGDAS